MSEAMDEAAKNEWVSASTIDIEITVILYNGELGIYSVIDLQIDLSKRGGQLIPRADVLTAEIPLRTATWTILEFLVAISIGEIVVTEIGDCGRSILACGCCSSGGYLTEFWNVSLMAWFSSFERSALTNHVLPGARLDGGCGLRSPKRNMVPLGVHVSRSQTI